MNYIKPGPAGVDPDTRERANALAKPLTPKSERRRRSWGSLLMSLQTSGGLCAQPKCVFKDGHASDHWPK